MAQTYYQILDLEDTFTLEEIRAKYHALALALHPDKNPNDESSTQRFQEINNAFHTLTDPHKRQVYDATLPKEDKKWSKFARCDDIAEEQEFSLQSPITEDERIKIRRDARKRSDALRRENRMKIIDQAMQHGRTKVFVLRALARMKKEDKDTRDFKVCLEPNGRSAKSETVLEWEQQTPAVDMTRIKDSDTHDDDFTDQGHIDGIHAPALCDLEIFERQHEADAQRLANATLARKEARALKRKQQKQKQNLKNKSDSAAFAAGLARRQQKQKQDRNNKPDSAAFATGLARRQQRKTKIAAERPANSHVTESRQDNENPETGDMTANTGHTPQVHQYTQDVPFTLAQHEHGQTQKSYGVSKTPNSDVIEFEACLKILNNQYLLTRTFEANHIEVRIWIEQVFHSRQPKVRRTLAEEQLPCPLFIKEQTLARAHEILLESKEIRKVEVEIEAVVQSPVPDEVKQAQRSALKLRKGSLGKKIPLKLYL